jgi:hypothetical protein
MQYQRTTATANSMPQQEKHIQRARSIDCTKLALMSKRNRVLPSIEMVTAVSVKNIETIKQIHSVLKNCLTLHTELLSVACLHSPNQKHYATLIAVADR